MLHLLWWTRILADPVYWEVQRFQTIISLDGTGGAGRIWRDCCMLRVGLEQGEGCPPADQLEGVRQNAIRRFEHAGWNSTKLLVTS